MDEMEMCEEKGVVDGEKVGVDGRMRAQAEVIRLPETQRARGA
jgi:hypothetical protein